jgi:hypothetical protein
VRRRPPAVALALVLALAGAALPARAASFLDEVDRGRSSVASADVASLPGAAARAAAVDGVVRRAGGANPAFAIGALLAALDLDLASDPAHGASGDRAVVERQVRDLLRAQAQSRIGNRALCLLSGRKEPRTLEAQIQLVDPAWSCGPRTHAHH